MGLFSFLNDNRAKKNRRETPTVEGHYVKLGRKAAFIRYACLFLVILFAVYSFVVHRDEITLENFRYMMKFINFGESAERPVGSVIQFDGSDGNRALVYKGDLAVLSESGLAITGWDGESVLKSSLAFDHPKMITNGSDLFCFDLGGRELRVYNSYSLLWSPPTFEYPIYWVAASAGGPFAVVSSAQGYRSAVYVYDREYREIYTCLFGNKYVDYAALSADGRELLIAGHYSESGDITAFVSRYSLNSEEPVSEYSFIGELPLGIYYTESGYALLTSDRLRTFEPGRETPDGVIEFAGKKLMSAEMYGDRALITYSTDGLSGGTELYVYDFGGNEIYYSSFSTSLSSTALCGDTVYSLSPGVLTAGHITAGDSEIFEIPTSFSALVTDGDRIILFSASEARYFDRSAANNASEVNK